MMKKYFFRILLIATSLLLVQCVSSQDYNSLVLRLRNLDRRIVKLDQTVEKYEGHGQNNPIDTLQRKQAEMADTLDKLNNEILELKGEIEESSHYYLKFDSENSEFKESIEVKITDISEQILLLVDQLNQASDQLVVIKEDTQKSLKKATEAEERAIAVEKEAEKTKVQIAQKGSGHREITPIQTKLSPQEKEKMSQKNQASGLGPGKEIYDQALSLYRSNKFNDAYRTFTKYIEKFPKGKMAPNARFWLGDCYYSQQEYELAILEYQKVIADYPDHTKAPAALLKQGLAFEKLNDKETAMIVYSKILDDYPKSEQISVVKKRLDSLK